MSCAAKPTINPLTTSNGYLISSPAIFTTKTSSYPCLSIPSKPIKLHISCYSYSSSSPSLLSLKKSTHSLKQVAFVAQFSDWAQQEDNTAVVDEEEAEFSWSEEGGEKGDAIGETESGGEEGFLDGGEAYPELNEDAKLFVGNLPYDIDNEKIAHFFEQAGVVEVAEVIYNRETDQSRGFGFVTMRTVEEAEKAMEMFHQYELHGRILTVNKAAPRGSRIERPPRGFEPRGFEPRGFEPRGFERSAALRLYVGNLPWDFDSTRLEQVFSEHGNVVDARVVSDRETGRSRGFGFVTMSTEAEVNDAIANINGQNIGGRSIRVNVADERPRRSF